MSMNKKFKDNTKTREATLECFEFAIKELEASLEPEEKKSIEL